MSVTQHCGCSSPKTDTDKGEVGVRGEREKREKQKRTKREGEEREGKRIKVEVRAGREART